LSRRLVLRWNHKRRFGKAFGRAPSRTFDGYTAHRHPVSFVFQQGFERIEDAVAAERQVKGWRRDKKAALIRGDYPALPLLASRAKGTESGPP
jgi:predicted GIY-YIG superfamily endonuclease